MTEDEWFASPDVEDRLFGMQKRKPLSSRKLILFCCACCRRAWHLLQESRSQRAVEAAELGADGLLSRQEITQSWQDAEEANRWINRGDWRTVSIERLALADAAAAAMRAMEAVGRLGEQMFDLVYHARTLALATRRCLAFFAAKGAAQIVDPPEHLLQQTYSVGPDDDIPELTDDNQYFRLEISPRILVRLPEAQIIRSAGIHEMLAQCSLLEEIFGDCFRTGTVDERLCKAGENLALKLAAAIYADRAFERLPLLADALEDAGSTDPDLLGHLRGPGPHVRGCWAVDLVLGKG
jgi:hypothetical protein